MSGEHILFTGNLVIDALHRVREGPEMSEPGKLLQW
jgi:hypothetical protein